MSKNATKIEEDLIETRHKYEAAEERAKKVEDKAFSIAAGIGGAAIGAAPGGAVGAAVGGTVAANAVSSAKVEESTGRFLSKAFKSISNFVTGAVTSVGNIFKKAGKVIKDTGAKVANFVPSAAPKVASFFCSVGDFVWTGIKKVGASIANIFTGLWDLGQWIAGKITGNEDWNSATKAMWGGVMDFVATTHVKDAFRGFFENTAVGKWLDANAFDDSIIVSDVRNYYYYYYYYYYYGVNPINHSMALKTMLEEKIKRGYIDLETIFHSDQGKIYSSMSFNNEHRNYNIKRSMSRIATPTDNPIIESKNGWLKKEIFIDFNPNDYETIEGECKKLCVKIPIYGNKIF